MTGRTFMKAVANGELDILQMMLDILEQTGTAYAVIGGLGVNAYAEPVVSLDLDLVIVSKDVRKVCDAAVAKGLKIQKFEHSINLSASGSDLRIQLQTDTRYQDFVSRAIKCEVLGYQMFAASLEDVLQGKIWAYSDKQRRKSKRQKDLSDIMRLVETHPHLKKRLPKDLIAELE